ncbi:hypothetical protein IPL85_03285 [Candidatus Saccharibacteria bacterium]|nr:MAG: hypothetical protein IPL85_03285 [Candidatus Saccharibacteria bacterium]
MEDRKIQAMTHGLSESQGGAANVPRKTVTLRLGLMPRGIILVVRAAWAKLRRAVNKLEKYILLSLPKPLARKLYFLRPKRRKHPVLARLGWGAMALLMLFAANSQLLSVRQKDIIYALSPRAEALLGKANQSYEQSLRLDYKQGSYLYNDGYRSSAEVISQGTPKFSASFSLDPKQGVMVTDPATGAKLTFVPEFALHEPRQSQNRLIYPVAGSTAQKVYTARAASIKEDIILNQYSTDSMEFKYTLKTDTGTEARMESDGSLGVYGVNSALLGAVSTGSESDTKLLEQARANGEKNRLLFTLPAPYIRESGRKTSQAKAWYSLNKDVLTVHATNLQSANYPLTIDPTVYIETARKLMKGNNETNVDFDVDNELIQKSQTTGARIDYWSDTTEMSSGVWDQAMASAGGFVYRSGGRIDPTMPYVASQQATTQATNSLSFTMNMPTLRPAGDLYVALIAKDGDNRVSPPAGWTEYADLQQHAAYYKEGTDQGGGNEAATYQWTVATTAEQWTGIILRIKNFNAGSPVSGTAGTTSAASGIPQFPATTPGHDATLVIRATGFDEDQPSEATWLPLGHTRVYSGTSSDTDAVNSAALVATTLDVPPLASNSTAAASLINDGLINDSYGASSIAIRPATVTAGYQNMLEWAQVNPSAGTIDSPNPGAGTCSGWCTQAVYNLPANRVGMSMYAYNGFLYAIGGTTDGTAANAQNTVWVAKLGANGEPQLWHPSGGTPTYWYASTNTLPVALSYTAISIANNRLYLLGGRNTGGTSVDTVRVADVLATGDIGPWSTTGMQNLPDVRHGHSVQFYNDVMYLIGGNSSGTLRNTVYFSKMNADGTMNSWSQTSTFTTARASMGGSMTTVWGGYVYMGGGCSGLTGAYCSTIASDVQLASINADGSLADWNTILNLSNQRIGYSLVAWQNGLYRFGGCNRQNTTTGVCYAVHRDVEYGIVNPDGDASTVSNSEPANTGNCVTPNFTDCDLPGGGDGAEQGGQMSNMVVINNGYIYVIGGCTSVAANNVCETAGTAASSGNVLYAAIDSSGNMTRVGTCGGTFVTNSLWCVDSTNRVNGTTGISAGSATVYNNVIYVIGGTSGSTWSSTVYRVSLNANGTLTGAWTTQTFAKLALGTSRGYAFSFTRSNPNNAATYPGNLYVLGGCYIAGGGTGDDGIGCSTYFTKVYKCNIMTSGALEEANANDCDTAGQVQIDADNINTGSQGLGLMAGTVYANRVYLVGGACTAVTSYVNPTDPCASDTSPVINNNAQRKETIYAKINDSNNIVDNDTGLSGGSWKFTTGLMNPVRRRAVAFGYNGYIYSLAGYSGTASLQDLLFAKIDVTTGDMGSFDSSGVVVTPRWDLRAIVGNGYVYAIGGCSVGAAPDGCTSMQPEIQTFQLYNNDSGAPVNYTALSDDTFAADTDRWGASAAVLNGYVYVAGGCISATDCTNATNNVQYAPISASDGTVGTWASATNGLPADRTWGQLEVAGGNLYYLGGQDDTATNEQSAVYYAGTFTLGDITAAWGTASGGIGDTASQAAQPLTRFGATVWNDRIYVVAGLDGSAANTNAVYISPQLASGGNIAADSWVQDADVPDVVRRGNTVVAYANNLYSVGGNNGTQYFNDSQFTQINSDGTIDAWTFSTSLPGAISEAEGFAANGYLYLVAGRSAASTCAPNTLVTPISANTTIASGNNPTGIGEWYETNKRYTGDRYGSAVAYVGGKIVVMGGGCTAPLSTGRHFYTSVKSQPQVAKYSRMIDTDTDVFPTKWLVNGLDNSTGARWYMRFRSMTDIDGDATDCVVNMTTWGQETNFGVVTLGNPETFVARDGSGTNTNCARYYYFSLNIDSSQAFGYPEDVNRGPTIADLSLFFTADPSKRLLHGKTFTGGEQQPLDTPF